MTEWPNHHAPYSSLWRMMIWLDGREGVGVKFMNLEFWEVKIKKYIKIKICDRKR